MRRNPTYKICDRTIVQIVSPHSDRILCEIISRSASSLDMAKSSDISSKKNY
ncbi:MAG: hypothetical protein KME23_03290 [Goleter apudmare HA4340-LM2]|nr:hypothetical protein [Goleter apudmare HA4340-LM2]